MDYGNQGRTDEAIREFQTALRINPDYAKAHYHLGMACGQQGRTDEEIREYQAALRINPDYLEAHFILGVTFEVQGRTEEAIQEYQAALRINPDDADAHDILGLAYEKLGRTEDAIREFQAVLRINPNHAGVHYNLGQVYSQQGRLAEARRETQKALQLGYSRRGNCWSSWVDNAISRRRLVLLVPEPWHDEALEMLRGVKARYEAHHGVMIADEALEAAVKLSVGWLQVVTCRTKHLISWMKPAPVPGFRRSASLPKESQNSSSPSTP